MRFIYKTLHWFLKAGDVMKRFLTIFLIALMFVFSGCPGGEEEKEKDKDNKMEVKGIETKAAKEFMDNYMRYLLRGDDTAAKSFYSSKVKESIKSDTPKVPEPHPVGYKIEGGESKKDKREMKATIYSSYTGAPYFSEDSFKYTLILEKGRLLIDKIEKEKSIEVFAKKNILYKREGDKVEGDKLLTTDELPYFATSKSAAEQKFQVSKDSFGPCAIASDGKKIVITTVGSNSLIAIAEMEESEEAVALEGGDKQGGGQGEGGGGGGAQGGEQPGGAQKKPKIKITPVDLYFKNKINVVNFSPDGKKFIVEFTSPDGMSRMLMYDSGKGDIVKTPIDKQFKEGSFSVKNSYFISDDEIVFNVEPGKDTTSEEKMLKGEWILDIKKQKLKQGK